MFRRRLIWNGTPKAPIVDGVPLVANVGDIAYKASNGKIMVVSPDSWDASLGTPVGVVVIPSGFAPDNGKARILSLNWASSSSTSPTSASIMGWGSIGPDISLPNYTAVPTTNNTSAALSGYSSYGYLPSDKFTGDTSYVDPTAKYGDNTIMIPSPYLGDTPNRAYSNSILIPNNTLSDFDGKGNTDVLVELGANYAAANAARNYKATGAEEIEWYLPAAGELGYMVVRYNKICAALTKVNAPQLEGTYYYWSSSEYSSNNAYYVYTGNGGVSNIGKGNHWHVRPFAQLDF